MNFSALLRQAGEMGIEPAAFWRLTFREFVLYSQGYARRARWWHRLAALVAAWIINFIPAFKARSAVTPEKLLGERKPDPEHR